MPDDEERNIVLQRILVAVDTSAHSRAALNAAATLARLMEADIRGLFVHEEHWSRLSRLPSITTINALTGESSTLEEESLEQHISLLKRRLNRELQRLSRQHDIEHSWDAVRGKVVEEILDAARDADLITIGRRAQSFPLRKHLGSTARSVIRKADKPVLVLKDTLNLNRTITVVYDASDAGRRGLRMGLALAERNESRLSVLVLRNRGHEEEEMRDRKLEAAVEQADIPVRISRLNGNEWTRFIRAVNEEYPGLLVIPKEQPFLEGDRLSETLRYIHCAVLLTV